MTCGKRIISGPAFSGSMSLTRNQDLHLLNRLKTSLYDNITNLDICYTDQATVEALYQTDINREKQHQQSQAWQIGADLTQTNTKPDCQRNPSEVKYSLVTFK